MSFAKLEMVKCACTHEFEALLYNSIIVEENPELKDALLCGEINIVQCPKCKNVFYAEQFLLYQELDKELIAFVYPISFATKAETLFINTQKIFEEIVSSIIDNSKINYEPVVIFGINSLVDIVQLDNNISDEVEILRYYALEMPISLVEISNAYSRKNGVVPLLPIKGLKDELQRTRVINGIKELLSINPNLENYRKTLEKIELNKNWNFDENKVIKKIKGAKK